MYIESKGAEMVNWQQKKMRTMNTQKYLSNQMYGLTMVDAGNGWVRTAGEENYNNDNEYSECRNGE